MSIEDNLYKPKSNYVAMIDAEAEFKITTSVIRQLSKDYMPAWGVKSYLDYFEGKSSGFLLFLRVYKVDQPLPYSYLEKGIRGSSQILKLYDEWEEEISFPITSIEPVISENKFSYLKDEILHLLKVENALIAFYDNTEKGIESLRNRIAADKILQGTKERWKSSHLQWVDNDSDEEDDDFDMAQLDYESIYREVVKICPGMEWIVNYIRNIRPARLGEYDYYLKDIHTHSKNEKTAFSRLFEMSLRAALKRALDYYKKYGVCIEDAFQEACIGVMQAIRKHNDNVIGLFPSYVGMWIRQALDRQLSPYEYNVRLPAHYKTRIDQVVDQMTDFFWKEDFREIENDELYRSLLNNSDCDQKEAFRLTYILTPSESIEEILNSSQEDISLVDGRNVIDEADHQLSFDNLRKAIASLSDKERNVILHRFGFKDHVEASLQEVGNIYGVTRERIRQIEDKAKQKIRDRVQDIYA